MSAVYGEHPPSYYQVKFWSKQFKWDRNSIEDDPRAGRPSDASTDEMYQAVEDFVMADRRVTVQVFTTAYEMCISEGSVINMLHVKLGMSNVSSRCVPRMLSLLQKLSRVEICRENLSLVEEDWENFCSRIVTGDETRVHYWDPGTKQESMQSGSTRHLRHQSNFALSHLQAKSWQLF